MIDANKKPFQFQIALPKFVVCLCIVAFTLGFAHSTRAQITALAESVVTEPSLMTKQAASGLFTAVTEAGSRLVAVGQDGRIMLSDDDGRSWYQVATPTSVTLTNVRFASPRAGWAVGQMGVVLHTADGGLHWAIQLDGARANKLLIDAAQADVTAQPHAPVAQTNLQNAQQLASGAPSLPFLALLPLSEKEVVIAGGFGMAFTSDDGGAAWRSIFDQIPNPNGLHVYSIIADGTHELWAGEQGLVLSQDAQDHFKVRATSFQGSFFGALRGPDGSLILYGLQGTILRSHDGGASWQQTASASSGGIDCGIVLTNGDELLGDVDGNLLLSRDYGKSFSLEKAIGPVTDLVQAADGAIITAGPQGLHVFALNSLVVGS